MEDDQPKIRPEEIAGAQPPTEALAAEVHAQPDGMPPEEVVELGEVSAAATAEIGPQEVVPEAYTAAAQERGIKPLEGGDWFEIDGVTTGFAGGGGEDEGYTYPTPSTQEEVAKRAGQVGKYCSNNGIVSFVDHAGRLRVGVNTEESQRMLSEAGYTFDSLSVPLSNQEPIKDPAHQDRWNEIRRKGYEKRQQEIDAATLRQYEAQAEAKGIKPVEGGDWFETDGLMLEFQGESIEEGRNTDHNEIYTRREQVGTFCSNNGIVAFVDEKGVKRVGVATKKNLQALQEAGYTFGSIGVPLSNQEHVSDPVARAKWEETRRVGEELREQEMKQENLEAYSREAEAKAIKPVEGGDWFNVDGITTNMAGEHTYGSGTDSHEARQRISSVGEFSINNGIMGFIDEKGAMRVGVATRQNIQALTAAGYKEGNLWVPLSNQEQIVNPTTQRAWDEVRERGFAARDEERKLNQAA